MKAIKYIAAIALLAGLVSCQQEFKPGVQTVPEPQSDMVEVSFSVQFPEPIPVNTKSPMGEGPLVAGFSLGFCIYGPGDGFVQNWQKAEEVTPSVTNGYITGGTFKVMLPLTNEKRIVHVIADIPYDVDPSNPNAEDPITNEYMDDVMLKLVTTDQEGAYWQEIVLENGIRQHVEGTTYVPDDDLVAALSNIHLIRNFAKMTVTNLPTTEEHDGFVVTRWALINVPDRGFVAPYTGKPEARFPKGYTDIVNYSSAEDLLEQLSGTGAGQDNYPGVIPPDAVIIESFPGDPDGDGAANYTIGGASKYMYERPLPTTQQKQTAVLIEVEFEENHSLTLAYNELHPEAPVTSVKYWYKVEALDSRGLYVPFYRNLSYTLRIEGLEQEGEATAEDAYNSSYFGNISASLETASLNELSDGVSTIHVDLMDYTFLTNYDGTPVTLMKNADEASLFWFIPDVSSPSVDAPQAYTESVEGICDIQVKLRDVTGYDPAIDENFTVNADGTIQITLLETGSKVKKSVIRVSGRVGDDSPTNNHKYIYRDITINLMETQSFIHIAGEEETSFDGTPQHMGANNPVKINLYLPEDLGASVFPIQVRVEAENNTLSATSPDLPVSTGKSVFDPAGKRNTYFFVRTITYSEYCRLDPRTKKYVYTYEFPMTFYTNRTGDNSTNIDIRDLAGDFIPKVLVLGNP